MSDKSKYMDCKYHFIRDKIQQKKLQIRYRIGTEIAADGCTKPLAATVFRKFCSNIGIVDRDKFKLN